MCNTTFGDINVASACKHKNFYLVGSHPPFFFSFDRKLREAPGGSARIWGLRKPPARQRHRQPMRITSTTSHPAQTRPRPRSSVYGRAAHMITIPKCEPVAIQGEAEPHPDDARLCSSHRSPSITCARRSCPSRHVTPIAELISCFVFASLRIYLDDPVSKTYSHGQPPFYRSAVHAGVS